MGRGFVAACLVVLLPACGLPAMTAAAQSPAPQLGRASVRDVVAAMTDEEKASLLVGMGMNLNIPGVETISPEDKAVPEKVPGAAGRTHAVPRLGVPSLTLADGPAGVRIDPQREGDARTYHATAFPVATLLASTWDAEAGTYAVTVGSSSRDIMRSANFEVRKEIVAGKANRALAPRVAIREIKPGA